MSWNTLKVKPKLCKYPGCPHKANGEKFLPSRPLQTCCSLPCAVAYAKETNDKEALKKILKARQERKNYRRRELDKLKTRTEHLNELQAIFNKFIRERDKAKPCISCGTESGTLKYDAGHYFPVSAYPAMRFEEDAVHRQCQICNRHKSGNLIEYRTGLIARVGLQRVEEMESKKRELKKYSEPEILEMKVLYKSKIKALMQELKGN